MNPFFSMMQNNPMLNIIRQVNQIKQNPSQLASLLKQRGLIDENQFAEVSKMGSDYEQIGHYLINNGRMPQNYHQYDRQVGQVQNFMNNSTNT